MRDRLFHVSHSGLNCVKAIRNSPTPLLVGRRGLQVSTRPFSALDSLTYEPPPISSAATPDARFEVIGAAPCSLLSVSLSASQILYSRRGTLVGLGGNAENVFSTLSVLEPFRRAFLAIPFLYQKISATSPVTALISTNSALAVVQLDGSTDWKLFGKALLAWTGQTLSIHPTLAANANLAHWGNSEVTGRGLLAVAGQGSIYEVVVNAGEEYIVHPSNVIAHTINSNPPSPYRLKSSSFRLQVPNINISGSFPNVKFFKVMGKTQTWQVMSKLFFNFRTWWRRTIWGDRLFLEFHGPTKILMQTRASRLTDVITSREIDEIAEIQPGARSTEKGEHKEAGSQEKPIPADNQVPRMSMANVGADGKVRIEAVEDSKT